MTPVVVTVAITGSVPRKAIAMASRRTQAIPVAVGMLWGARVQGPNRRCGRAIWRGGSG